MHTRRLAAFLLGAWIGCGLLMLLLALENFGSPGRVLFSPPKSADKLIKKLGAEDARLLLAYQAAEQSRAYMEIWERAQMALAVMLGVCLLLGTQRRVVPLVLCGMMLALVWFQHFAVLPELTYRGREADFLPGNSALGIRRLIQIYAGLESVKLLFGG